MQLPSEVTLSFGTPQAAKRAPRGALDARVAGGRAGRCERPIELEPLAGTEHRVHGRPQDRAVRRGAGDRKVCAISFDLWWQCR